MESGNFTADERMKADMFYWHDLMGMLSSESAGSLLVHIVNVCVVTPSNVLSLLWKLGLHYERDIETAPLEEFLCQYSSSLIMFLSYQSSAWYGFGVCGIFFVAEWIYPSASAIALQTILLCTTFSAR